jgi:hypothetical protein
MIWTAHTARSPMAPLNSATASLLSGATCPLYRLEWENYLRALVMADTKEMKEVTKQWKRWLVDRMVRQLLQSCVGMMMHSSI